MPIDVERARETKYTPKIESEGYLVRYLVFGRTRKVTNQRGNVISYRRVAAKVFDGDKSEEKFIPMSGKIPEGVQILTIDQVREQFGEGSSKEAQKALRKAERRRLKIKELRGIPSRKTPQ